jgi:hypothetical protein
LRRAIDRSKAEPLNDPANPTQTSACADRKSPTGPLPGDSIAQGPPHVVRAPTSSTPRCQARRAASTWSTALPPSFPAVRPNARSWRRRSRNKGPPRTSRNLSWPQPQTSGVTHRLKIVHIQSSRLSEPVGTTRQAAPDEATCRNGATRQSGRLTTGQLVPPLNPVTRWGHQSVRRARMGPPVSFLVNW